MPDDRTLLIERTRDDLGDWRVLVLSSLGSRVHAPWAMAVSARLRDELGLEAETMWGDDGFVVRFPEGDAPPDPALMLPDPDEVEGADSAAARIDGALCRALSRSGRRARCCCRAGVRARARRSGSSASAPPICCRSPRATDRSRSSSRPIAKSCATSSICRRCVDVLRRIRSRSLRVATIESRTPSPFAASLLFNYVANYIYDGDAPLAERRAQALAVDQSQLRELIGEAELRDLLDTGAIETVEADLQHLARALSRQVDRRRARSAAAPRRSDARRDRARDR